MINRFSETPPGPGLGVRLAMVNADTLPDETLLELVHAHARQAAFQQAELWAAMARVHARLLPLLDRSQDGWNLERVFACAASEIAAELRLSQGAAERELDHALRLRDLPAVAAALRAGELDRVRVVVLLEICADLTDRHRDTVLAEIVPVAGTITVAKVKATAQRLAIALDPAWAERRYREAIRRRRVVHYVNEDGTVAIVAADQPADVALAAMARLTALAKAAQRAGAHATRAELRSELMLGLLTPRFAGHTEAQIIADLVDQFPKPLPQAPVDTQPTDTQPTEPAPAQRQGTASEQNATAERSDEAEPTERGDTGIPSEPAEHDSEPASSEPTTSPTAEPDSAQPTGPVPAADAARAQPERISAVGRRDVVEIEPIVAPSRWKPTTGEQDPDPPPDHPDSSAA